MDNSETVRGLRKLADYLEAYPQLCSFCDVGLIQCVGDKEEMAEIARQHAPLEKTISGGDWFALVKRFAPEVTIRWILRRDKICRRVVTGKHNVTVPAQPAREATPEQVVEVEDFEWKWDPILS